MKVRVFENSGCFGIELEPENTTEINLLVRMGMNTTSQLRSCRTYAHNNGVFSSSVVIAKHRRADSDIPKRK
jgi:hypothetical protein